MMGFNDEDRREIVKYRLEKSLCTYKGLSKEWFLTDKGEMQKSFVVNHNFVQGELTNILVVVIRYFGGVKLGTSGLIVAYKEAAALAIDDAETEERLIEEKITYTFTYVMMNDVMRIVKDMQPRIVSQSFDNTCEITLAIRRSQADQLKKRLEQLSF